MALPPTLHPPLHPMIRVITLVVFAAILPALDAVALGTLSLALFVAHLPLGADALARLGGLCRRTRGLALALIVLYLAFTPGPPLAADAPSWLPSRAGCELALVRLLALASMVAAVNLLLVTTPRAPLVGALAALARGLAPLGVDGERAARRLVLALERLAAVETEVRAARAGLAADRNYGELAARLVSDAERAAPAAIEVPRLGPPRAVEWLVPAALAGGALARILG